MSCKDIYIVEICQDLSYKIDYNVYVTIDYFDITVLLCYNADVGVHGFRRPIVNPCYERGYYNMK